MRNTIVFTLVAVLLLGATVGLLANSKVSTTNSLRISLQHEYDEYGLDGLYLPYVEIAERTGNKKLIEQTTCFYIAGQENDKEKIETCVVKLKVKDIPQLKDK